MKTASPSIVESREQQHAVGIAGPRETGRKSIMRCAARQTALGMIWLYQHCVSPWTPGCCRFHPTCSSYARLAVRRFGVVRGGFLTVCRLAKCHPFYRGALHDPVPTADAGKPRSVNKGPSTTHE